MKQDSVECRYVALIMTKPCSAASYTSTPHYSTLNFTDVEDRWLLHSIVKIQLDMFGYSGVSELQNFPTLATRLGGFCPRIIISRPKSDNTLRV